jgi:hypothetical protein
VIVHGRFNGSQILNVIFEGGHFENTPLSSKWKPVVLKSAEKCQREVIIDGKRIPDDDFNFVYTKFTECVRKMNFLGCPDMSKSANCSEVSEVVEKDCDATNYSFLHEFFFEDFYYRNHSEKLVTMARTTGATKVAGGDEKVTKADVVKDDGKKNSAGAPKSTTEAGGGATKEPHDAKHTTKDI